MNHQAFISYSRQDQETADALLRALENAGIPCWIAPRDVPAGTSWKRSIVEAVRGSRLVVLVFSSASNGSAQVRREIDIAFEARLPILPLRIEDVALHEELYYCIAARHWLDALDPPLEQHVGRLVQAAREILTAAPTGGEAHGPPAPGASPPHAPLTPGRPASRHPAAPGADDWAVEGVPEHAVESWVLAGHDRWVSAAGFSPDGRLIVTASEFTVRLWHGGDPASPPVVLRGHTGEVRGTSFSPDGRRILSYAEDGTALLWQVADPAARPVVLAGHDGWVLDAEFSPDGKWIVTSADAGTTRVWRADALDAPVATAKGHVDHHTAAEFSADSRWLVVPVFRHLLGVRIPSRTALLWRTDGMDAPRAELRGHSKQVLCARFSPDVRWVVTTSADHTVRLRALNNLQAPPVVFSMHTGPVNDAAFSPDSHWLVTSSDDMTARLWDTRVPSMSFPTPFHTLRGHSGAIWSAEFSPDGRTVVTTSADRTARLWRTEGPTITELLTGERAMRAEGASVATLVIGETTGGFSQNGQWIAATAGDETARLWRVDDFTAPPVVLRGHSAKVTIVRFSPDGRSVLTKSDDQVVRIWRFGTGVLGP